MTAQTTRPGDTEIEAAILRCVREAGPGRTVGPSDVARTLHAGDGWQSLLPALRRVAIRLALAGEIAVYRKGKPADPNDFKGVYRLGLPPRA